VRAGRCRKERIVIDATQYIQRILYDLMGTDAGERQQAIAKAVDKLRTFAQANEQLKAALLAHAERRVE
jgi:hypothetical protein